ncbi:1-aminocyclopropane-1-carboxylate oxidase homolog 1-like protein [Tanacetum coccineum]
MAATSTTKTTISIVPPYDPLTELKAFNETKSGVKGLVDMLKSIESFTLITIRVGGRILNSSLAMAATSTTVATPSSKPNDRLAELQAFDETKSGVKGLVDHGIQQIPRIFIHPQETSPTTTSCVKIPVIDLASTDRQSI